MPVITCSDLPAISLRSTRDEPRDRVGVEILTQRPPTGEAFWWVRARRIGITTAQARGAISRAAEVDQNLVTFAGARDRDADITQWFCVPQEPVDNPGGLRNAGFRHALRVTEVIPSAIALAPEMVQEMEWNLRLHPEDATAAWHVAKPIIERLRRDGGANAFAHAELGPGGRHAKWGRMLAQGRRLPERVRRADVAPPRLLRAFQAGAFNRYLEARQAGAGLGVALVGDWLQTGLNRGHAGEVVQVDDAEAATRRIESGEAALLGPLLGEGLPACVDAAAAFEQEWLAQLGLTSSAVGKLHGARRPLTWRGSDWNSEIEREDVTVKVRMSISTRIGSLIDELTWRPSTGPAT